jgi:hypothetical protein
VRVSRYCWYGSAVLHRPFVSSPSDIKVHIYEYAVVMVMPLKDTRYSEALTSIKGCIDKPLCSTRSNSVRPLRCRCQIMSQKLTLSVGIVASVTCHSSVRNTPICTPFHYLNYLSMNTTSCSDLSDSMSVGQTLSTPLLSNLLEHECDECGEDDSYDEEEGCMPCSLMIVASSKKRIGWGI